MRVPQTTRRSNQSIPKEVNPEYSLEGLMLKLQYFGHLMQRASSLEKTLILGKTEGRRRRGQQKMRWLDGITNSVDMGSETLGRLFQGPVIDAYGLMSWNSFHDDWKNQCTSINAKVVPASSNI